MTIQVACLDGRYRRTLITGDMDSPRAIALDPNAGIAGIVSLSSKFMLRVGYKLPKLLKPVLVIQNAPLLRIAKRENTN